MLILGLLLLAYLMSVVVTYFIARASIDDRAYRLVFFAIAAVLPVLAIWSFVLTLFKRTEPIAYNHEVAAVEDAIEARRVQIFGCEPLRPSLSEHWQRSCQAHMQKMAVKAAGASQRIRELTAQWSIGRV